MHYNVRRCFSLVFIHDIFSRACYGSEKTIRFAEIIDEILSCFLRLSVINIFGSNSGN